MIDFVIDLGGAFFGSSFWLTYIMPVLGIGMLIFGLVLILDTCHYYRW